MNATTTMESEPGRSRRDESSAPCALGPTDVALVSGGGKGITFELALALARQTGCRLALLGSSPLDATQGELGANLQRLKEADIIHAYFQADVTDLAAVRRAAADATRQLGDITGILHGAGITQLRLFREKSQEDFLHCIRVKARGLYNLLAAVPPARLKALHVISSVLGNSGMRGQTDYTFANAWLDGAVKSVKATHPHIHCLSLGYSVWAETGLGRKIGAVESLRAVGVSSISVKDGVAAYRALLHSAGSGTHFIITGRLTSDLEANLYPAAATVGSLHGGRFLEKIRRWIPGTEIIADATLSHATDLYLPEHVFEGTPMFPGVMAIEAMVQAARACAGREGLPVLRNVAFLRPLIVPAEGSVIVRTLALAEESVDGALCVRVAMRSAGDDFQDNHFEAECWFGLPAAAPAALPPCPPLPAPMDKHPEAFSPSPLFQGKFFRRITAVRRQEMETQSLADLECSPGEVYYGGAWSQTTATSSPAMRDAALQSGAIILPRGCLPVSLGELRLHKPACGPLHCHTVVKARTATGYVLDNAVFDSSGDLVETMQGLVLQALKDGGSLASAPVAPPVPVSQVSAELRVLSPQPPHVLVFVHHGEVTGGQDLPEMSPADRQQIVAGVSGARSVPALASHVAARRAMVQFSREHGKREAAPAGIGLAHRADGKPELHGADVPAGLDLSLADSADVTVALLGPPPVGVDLEIVACRDCETWRGLLGMDGYALALRVQGETGESFDCAATRVWALLEAGKKAHSLRRILPQFAGLRDGSWLSFKAEDAGPPCEFVSVLLSQSETVSALAVVVSDETNSPGTPVPEAGDEIAVASGTHNAPQLPAKFRFDRHGFGFKAEYAGPQGQLLFTKRFPVLFRDCRTASRKVEFTQYASWLGDIRENVSHGIFPELMKLIDSGKWGLATNYFRLQVCGELSPGDIVEGRFWQEPAQNEVWTLKCEWRTTGREGKITRVAFAEMGYSVVRILGHGVARIEAMPEKLREFFAEMLPRPGVVNSWEELPGKYKDFKLGEAVWQQANAPDPAPLLFSHEIATTTESSNWVGNIYFANYGEWMGRVRDLYFHRLTPQSFKHHGQDGEWVCLDCAIEHLSEAMPYDVIRVEMRVTAIYRCGVGLSFDYYLLENGRPARKLAHGTHRMAWVGRAPGDEPVVLALPESVVTTLSDQIRVIHRDC